MQMISVPLHSTTNNHHLDNNREVVDAKGRILQRTNYYAFGLTSEESSSSIQPYKYNGKEFDNMHGLSTYDYGARQYNPVTGRWDRIDPLCEKYYNVSPYAYCANNPVLLLDLDGRDWVEGANGNIVWRNSVVSSNYQQILKNGEIYRGTDYIRYVEWNNSRAQGLVQEHYLPNKTLAYEVHNGTFQFDFSGEVVSSKELTGKQLGNNHAAIGIRGIAYLNAVFSNGGTYTVNEYAFTSGPYGNGPTPNHNYTGSDFSFTSQEGMKIGNSCGWKVYMEDFNGRTGLRMHPDTNAPGTAGCIGIQGTPEALKALGQFLYDYIKKQDKNIQINFIITGNPNYGNNGNANPNLGQ